jgi:hypothetical protein
MTLSRLILIALVVGAAVAGAMALNSAHHAATAPNANLPGVQGLTNAIHAAQGVVQQSQQPAQGGAGASTSP